MCCVDTLVHGNYNRRRSGACFTGYMTWVFAQVSARDRVIRSSPILVKTPDCFVKWQVVVIQTSSDSDWVRLKSTACLALSQARERFQIWLGLGGRPHWLGVWVGREQFIVALSRSGDKGVCLDVELLVESEVGRPPSIWVYMPD